MNAMVAGLMQEVELSTTLLIQHAARQHGSTEIVSRRVEGDLHRYTYAEAYARVMQAANALRRLGIAPGERVATLAVNGYRHFELYFAIPGIGAVCHTINPRLHPDQLVYIVNHAADQVVCYDACFRELVRAIAPACPGVRAWICLADSAVAIEGVPVLAYEPLLAAEPAHIDWPQLDERSASALCFTSGTTGHPKGVLYSHRSTVLHAMAVCWPDSLALSAADAMCPIVPMFHVNAWGLPYGAALTGCKLVLAGAALDGANVHQLFEAEGVTLSAGVPTVWLGLLGHVEQHGLRFSSLRRVITGGAAMTLALWQRFEALGVEAVQAWGMTELSPLGSVNRMKFGDRCASAAERRQRALKAGRPPFGVDLRIVDASAPGAAQPLPHDGVRFGNLQARGTWVLQRYFGEDHDAVDEQGWFDTGDVATIDSQGYVQITDRAKDVIKSGGEWISSIDLEQVAMSFPGVAEAAAIAVPDEKWSERPALVVVAKPGVELDPRALLAFYEGKVARWWIPDQVHVVPELPHNATGKVQKLLLRQRYGGG